MSNNYFQFRQFRIEQELCAMKVTTDACIQGAWTPVLPDVKRVLDVGAGTGLLSLMLAQRANEIIIDGVEFDRDAARQATENVNGSLWKGRITIHEADARSFAAPVKYDLIISNPPFFNDSLLSSKEGKNLARHTLSLSYTDLLKVLNTHLADDGYASVMLPFPEYQKWQVLLAQNEWFELSRLYVKHTMAAPAKRVVGLFSKKKVLTADEQELVIMDDNNKYTNTFTDLLSPFYLSL